MSETLALKEYVELQRQGREKLIARVRHAATINPDLSRTLLAERFNLTIDEIEGMISGIPRERDEFSIYLKRKRRAG